MNIEFLKQDLLVDYALIGTYFYTQSDGQLRLHGSEEIMAKLPRLHPLDRIHVVFRRF